LAVLRDLPYVKEEIDYLEQLHQHNRIELDTLKRLEPSLQEDEMEAVEEFFRKKKDIAHFACHLRLNQSSDSSSLVVSNQFELSPHLLTEYGVSIAGNPLFVLNACDSGIYNPLQMSGFISFILNYADSIGVVATECKVPSQFATAFAKQFYDRFLIQNMSIGQALVKTRQAFMEPKYYNPLGLLYSLYQVDPDFHLTKVPNPRLRRTS
jgi:CHAT domain-containing protein